jgi:hypothetical protein
VLRVEGVSATIVQLIHDENMSLAKLRDIGSDFYANLIGTAASVEAAAGRVVSDGKV